MMYKKKTLPKHFEEIIRRGDIEELKAVYKTCELTAYTGWNKGNALFCSDISPEFVHWLVEQGLDINSRDSRQGTPLHMQARYKNSCLETFLKLGADVNAKDMSGETPLHHAAAGRNVEAVKCLIQHGAEIDAVDFLHKWTPMEEMLAGCMNIDIVETVKTAEVFLKAGAKVNRNVKKYITRIGENFEFHKENFNPEYLGETAAGLKRLYQLFEVPPVSARKVYDGVSPITVTSKTWQKQHNELWTLLVPGTGHATTIQGEVIRITGKVSYEILDNGGINWDSDYGKMLKALQAYFRMGNMLSDKELAEADKCISKVSTELGEKETEKLCELAVHWVLANGNPIDVGEVSYRR